MANKNNEDIYCSFCGKPQEMAGRLIAGNGVYICDRCVELCMNILRESGELERENENKLSKSGDKEIEKKSQRKSRQFLMNMLSDRIMQKLP